jgi:hypothetical protein
MTVADDRSDNSPGSMSVTVADDRTDSDPGSMSVTGPVPVKLTTVTGWTTERVAQELGVKVRTVHHHVQAGNLHPQKYYRRGYEGGPINLFDPAEVQAYAQCRVDARTEVAVTGPLPPSQALVKPVVYDVPEPKPQAQAPLVPVERKRFLTLIEAVAYTGLGGFYLLEHCESRRIGPHTARVFRRKDLDRLCDSC